MKRRRVQGLRRVNILSSCAVGACLSVGVKLGVPEPASEFFSARAKALLDVEMDSPSVATVQALVVMSASEAAFTRDARGWLYSGKAPPLCPKLQIDVIPRLGMAVRLSADLGLHLDLSDHVRNGILTQREMEVRRTTFWGVFIHDKCVTSLLLLLAKVPDANCHQYVESIRRSSLGYQHPRHINIKTTKSHRPSPQERLELIRKLPRAIQPRNTTESDRPGRGLRGR